MDFARFSPVNGQTVKVTAAGAGTLTIPGNTNAVRICNVGSAVINVKITTQDDAIAASATVDMPILPNTCEVFRKDGTPGTFAFSKIAYNGTGDLWVTPGQGF
jgi:hypothetical protein